MANTKIAKGDNMIASADEFEGPSEWMIPGAEVYYHSIIDDPHDGVVRTIRSEPWKLGHGQWLVLITGVTGGVALEALSQVETSTEEYSMPLTDEEMAQAFSGTNFGSVDYAGLIREALLKIVCDYYNGHTIERILVDLNLSKRVYPNYRVLTARGKKELYRLYEKQT
jgi:hypothetical protein